MKVLILILVVLLVGTNVFWIYSIFDRAITIDHSSKALIHCEETTELLKVLVADVYRKVEMSVLAEELERTFPTSIIKIFNDAIMVDSLVFIFVDDKLQAIKTLNQMSSTEYSALENSSN